MNDVEIKRIQKKAKYVATKKGYRQLADDFAQEIILKFLEGHGQHQTVDQAFIDYLREQYGRTGTPGGDARSYAVHSMGDLDEARHIAADPGEQQDDLRFDHLFGGVKYIIYAKRFVEERNLKEIGEMLGVSESRVCQIVSGIEKEMRDEILFQEVIHQMETDPNFTKLYVDWIKL